MSIQVKDTAKTKSVFQPSFSSTSLVNSNKTHSSLFSNAAKSSNLEQNNSSKYNNVLNLQKTAGNQAVQRLLTSGNTQVNQKVSNPADKKESETDKISEDKLKSKSSQPPSLKNKTGKETDKKIDKKCDDCEKKEKIGDKEEKKKPKIGDKEEKKKQSLESAESISPEQAIAPAIHDIDARTKVSKDHAPGESLAESSQSSAIEQKTQQVLEAGVATVKQIDAASQKPAEIKRDDFKTNLKAALLAAVPVPKTEKEANKVFNTGDKETSGALRGQLGEQKKEAIGPMESAIVPEAEVSPETQAVPATPELIVQQTGPPLKPVSTESVVPAVLPEEKLDYSEHGKDTEQLMSENKMTDEQLQRANEPDFAMAVESKNTALTNETSQKNLYRESESTLLDKSRDSATKLLDSGVQSFYGGRKSSINKVTGDQQATKKKTSEKHKWITTEISKKKNATQTKVQTILTNMETHALSMFEQGLKEAEKAYTDTFGVEKGGTLESIGDFFSSFFSGEDESKKRMEHAFNRARREYEAQAEIAIDKVASYVDGELKKAKEAVANGKREVDKFVDELGVENKKFGEIAKANIMGEFDEMVTGIDKRRDQLVDSLVEQYTASQQRLSETEQRLREENKSLWERAYEATVGVVEKIIEFKNLLLSVLSSAADLIEAIIDDPIGFLGKLVNGIKAGLHSFIAHIGEHLKKGFLDWLFGAISGAGIEIPKTFDVMGVLKLVMDILGISYKKIRDKIAKVVGEEKIAQLEKLVAMGEKIAGYAEEGFKIFGILKNEGLLGLWEYIKEKLDSITDMVLEQIKSWVQEKVLIGGLMWIVSLLNPAAAFVKAVMGIYDLVMLFIDRFAEFKELAESIIGTLSALAKGDMKVVANAVENALANFVPVAIGILASLLKLGGISDKIKKVIEGVQGKVDLAIDWVIQKIVILVKKIGKMLGFGKEEKMTKATKEGSTDIVLQAGNKISTNLPEDATEEDVNTLIVSTLNELKPLGLKSLKTKEKDDQLVVVGEASPEATAVELALLGVGKVGLTAIIEGGKRSIVRDSAPGFQKSKGTKNVPSVKKSKYSDIVQYDVLSAMGVSNAKIIDDTYKSNATEQEISEGKAQEIFEGKAHANHANHAEYQFVGWYVHQPVEFRKGIKRVDVILTHSPCERCVRKLMNVIETDEDNKFNMTERAYTLEYLQYWHGTKNAPKIAYEDMMGALGKIGWKVSGPAPKSKGRPVGKQKK